MDVEPAPVSAIVAAATQPVRVTSAALFNGQRYLVIVHEGQEYRLQITKAGKLILTK